nr:lytic transglycosylase domain-containing protein [uncultured Treponema sp.]
MIKRTTLAFLALTAFPLFAEPVADFLIPSTSITIDANMIDDLEHLRALEIEKKAEKKKSYIVKAPVHKDIGLSGLDDRRTKKFLDYYLSSEGRKYLAELLIDSAQYRVFVRDQLKKKKLPMFLQYLPIVESEYKPNAVSVSGATGMWQFMENSMEPFLKKNEWYDERLDPWIETEAALSKLKDNYSMLGNWELALAAYNMGAGAVKRVKKQSKADFWMLADLELLSEQSILYVPKLIAITEAVENAEYYGAIDLGVADKWIELMAPEKFGKLKITGSIKLETIAEKSGVQLAELKRLNPALIKGCTPPKETWILRVPSGKAKEIAKSLK